MRFRSISPSTSDTQIIFSFLFSRDDCGSYFRFQTSVSVMREIKLHLVVSLFEWLLPNNFFFRFVICRIKQNYFESLKKWSSQNFTHGQENVNRLYAWFFNVNSFEIIWNIYRIERCANPKQTQLNFNQQNEHKVHPIIEQVKN